ncbi:hypothetical protein BESB_015370 [Besnoitia besnoiti]|uniref:PH domain-containing protein n=1 Tax=Besnoitia besnoiti TaxID=94643 RepID=A0A2A9M6V6_BESBE|nr:hypothetical protein BESB_015370 [Besnoitia besnoiti]PFH32924.1 hypothetical protein BESB_015370 [Besnoitia besnoiti]
MEDNDVLEWKARRCVLRAEALWYTDAEEAAPVSPSSASSTSPSASSVFSSSASPSSSSSPVSPLAKKGGVRWSFIPLRDCVQLVAPPHDAQSFLLQTRERSHYWRAKSQSERDAWLLSLATQCVSVREGDLLRDVELRIREGEKKRSSAALKCLESTYTLDGALALSDTQELFEGFVVDFFRTASERSARARGRSQADARREEDETEAGSQRGDGETPHDSGSDDEAPPKFTLEQVLRYIRGFDPRAHSGEQATDMENPSGASAERGACEEAPTAAEASAADTRAKETDKSQGPGAHAPSDTQREQREKKEIHRWLEEVIFPKFMGSPIIQRRVVQLAASRSVVSWGCDPLRSPLLCSLEHTGGFSR